MVLEADLEEIDIEMEKRIGELVIVEDESDSFTPT